MEKRQIWAGRVLFDLRYKSLRYSGNVQMDMSSLQMVIRVRGWEVGGSGHNGLCGVLRAHPCGHRNEGQCFQRRNGQKIG